MELLLAHQDKDQHVLGMLFECTFHNALNKDQRTRAALAGEMLKTLIPNELHGNVPLQINRGRLATLAQDRSTFNQVMTLLRSSRVELFG